MKKKYLGIFLALVMFFNVVPTFGQEEGSLPYYIKINLTDNIVTVYDQDEAGEYNIPVKAFVSSAGADTPVGTFHTTERYEWRPLFGDVYGQYATRITGHILFHSVPYFEMDKSTLEYEEYNKLGQEVSMGCIRLTAEDAKWIYDNCPTGTAVTMYRGQVEEPLSPPIPVKVDVNDARRGWDPTDPDPQNPWNQGALVEMTMKSGEILAPMTVYYRDGSYFLTGMDAEKLFVALGPVVKMPMVIPEAEKGMAMIRYNSENEPLSYYKHRDAVYYKIRDIATATGAVVTWNKAEEQIDITYTTQAASNKVSLMQLLRGSERSGQKVVLMEVA